MRITLVSFFSFLLYYYYIHITFQISIASAKCLGDQHSLLLQLRNSLQFESSTKLQQWNQSIACCSWSGVTCDSEGHVIGLDLSEEYMSDGFDSSSSLFSLKHLQKLNLAYTMFVSVIPSGFNKLVMLNYLNLSYSSFEGEIPIEISQLTNLVTLDISGPRYSEMNNLNLQKFLQNLTKIRHLYLDDIRISSQGHKWSNSLLPLRELQELSMSHCGLSGPLDSSLSKLENLSVIILDRNNFSSPVPETFADFKNLTTLSLEFCGLTGTFPHKIFQIRTLSVIDLSLNYNLHGFFPDYSLSESIQSIIVSVTNFSGSLPYFIGNSRHLSVLDLSVCQFKGKLPNSLSNLTKLRYMDLSSNSFTGPMPAFGMAKSLTYLDLSKNNLSGEIPLSLKFERLKNLVTINLSHNSINGSIPTALFTLPLLQNILLSFNHFSRIDEFTIMPSSILGTLDLSRNNLSGPLPISIFQLSSLYSLDLSFNKFTDLSYGNLSVNGNVSYVDQPFIPNISSLILASCNLKIFPSFLINHSALQYLDLSDNQIHGIIPNWIWKLEGLNTLNISHNFLTDLEGPLQNFTSDWLLLDLHNNHLKGSIPVFFKSADYLDYSANNFSVIPQDIGNYMSSTIFLSLSNNNLQGSFPRSLCNASQLQVLDISFNNISGTFYPCLVLMASTLEVLNIRKNNLAGPIPDIFQASCSLRTLNIHGNLLHGPIPKSLSHCSSLKVLDIGSNQFLGGFPCFLKNIPTLSVLVLRNNKFHGSVECSLSQENMPWKMIQIVDIAFNNFDGKIPEKYFTAWERMTHDEDNNVSEFIHIERRIYSYYQDSVTISSKGQQMELVKILTIFTTIDFSSNNFEGRIPKVLMKFKAIHVLNFSNNALSGEIPSNIGNLKQLESLDLSNNYLIGEIPEQLATLSFLSYLNLSFNHLVGKIPTGTQLQSFDASSFEGNDGLYGPPLTETPNKPHPQPTCERLTRSIDWNFLSVELGFVFGLGIIIGPLLFWKKWRVSYWKLVDKILCWIFRRMHFEYVTDRGQTYKILRW